MTSEDWGPIPPGFLLVSHPKRDLRILYGCGSNQWYYFGVSALPNLVCFSGDWDVHWGIPGVLTHGHINIERPIWKYNFKARSEIDIRLAFLNAACSGLRKR